MKELEKIKPDNEMAIIAEQIKSHKKLARLSVVPIDGGKYWEIDLTDETIIEAEITESEVFNIQNKEPIHYRTFDGAEPMSLNHQAKKSLKTNKNKVYVYALNKASALKKLKKAKIVFHTFED